MAESSESESKSSSYVCDPPESGQMKSRLDTLRKDIEKTGIARQHGDTLEKRGISVDDFLNPSLAKDLKNIQYYRRINAGIKNKFLQFGLKVKKVSKFSKESYETPGHVWDALLSKWIRQYYPVDCESSKVEKGPATLLILDVELLHDLTFLDSKFPLFGFMREVAKDQKKHPELYLWQGEADAIAYSCALKKYVIVDFKVVDNLSDYCKSKTDLCGKHLHQCLVYSKLLQLHMKLDYLPPSLIVVIHKATGKEGYFPLFKDYPQECKDRLNEYEWFTEQPSKRPLKIANTNKLLKQKYRSQELYFLPDARLRDIFAMNATAKDLLDSLGYDSLEIFRQEQ